MDESLDDHEFLADYCANSDDLRNTLWFFDMLKVESITAIPRAEIQAGARVFAGTTPAAILYGLETLVPEVRGDCVRALVNLALATGNLGKPSTGLFPMFPGANEQGSKDVGCSPAYLPGYEPISDEGARQRFRTEWNAEIPSGEGLPLGHITDAIRQGRIKALQIIGNSPNFTNGELGDFLDAAKGLEFLVVQDTFTSEITEIADLVLCSNHFRRERGYVYQPGATCPVGTAGPWPERR